jgi:hypothetical protein
MKNLKKHLLSFIVVLAIVVFVTSCSDSDDKDNGTSRIVVKLTDEPGDYDNVFIEVLDVKIKNSSDEGEGMSIGDFEPGIYDLLELKGGVTLLLADTDTPSGYIGQMRLILGNENTEVKDGVTHPLSTPSAQQSGLKLQIDQTL